MKRKLSILIYALLSLYSIVAMSADISAGQWTTYAEVTSVQIHDNSIFALETNTTDHTSASCASQNGTYWWPATDHLAKEIYSSALAAFASGKKVSVVYADECNLKSKRLTHIIIKD
ncbi:hypothetical protein B6A42_07890 [Vibrio coralliilyticus]|nr:hypothetical protein B6A42_07890 [Vibrio coralliilyticus]